MDLKNLKTLIVVAELGSFTSAAGVVNLTQSAVSQQLKELESELGTNLLDRSKRPVTLTKEGVELVDIARQMLNIWQGYKEKHIQEDIEGKLVIGYVNSIMTNVLAHALMSLREKHPKLIIKLVNSGGITKRLVKMVEDGEIDACFGVGPLKVPKGFLWRPYSVERFFVISRLKETLKTDEELLTRGPYLRFVPYLLAETMIDREIKKRGIHVEASMEFDSFSSILLMVKHDIGIGIVPESYVTSKELTHITCVPFSVPPLTREMGIVVSHDHPKKHLVNELWKAMYHFSNLKPINPENIAIKVKNPTG